MIRNWLSHEIISVYNCPVNLSDNIYSGKVSWGSLFLQTVFGMFKISSIFLKAVWYTNTQRTVVGDTDAVEKSADKPTVRSVTDCCKERKMAVTGSVTAENF